MLVRRSSKIPSLEDIQETLSQVITSPAHSITSPAHSITSSSHMFCHCMYHYLQDTRRSSEETSADVTRHNSIEQVVDRFPDILLICTQ